MVFNPCFGWGLVVLSIFGTVLNLLLLGLGLFLRLIEIFLRNSVARLKGQKELGLSGVKLIGTHFIANNCKNLLFKN